MSAQSSVSATAGLQKLMPKVKWECCAGFVMMASLTECDRLPVAMLPLYTRALGCEFPGRTLPIRSAH